MITRRTLSAWPCRSASSAARAWPGSRWDSREERGDLRAAGGREQVAAHKLTRRGGLAHAEETTQPFADASRLVAVGGSVLETVYALGEEARLVARKEMLTYFFGLLDSRKNERRDDITSFLLDQEVDGQPLTRLLGAKPQALPVWPARRFYRPSVAAVRQDQRHALLFLSWRRRHKHRLAPAVNR